LIAPLCGAVFICFINLPLVASLYHFCGVLCIAGFQLQGLIALSVTARPQKVKKPALRAFLRLLVLIITYRYQ
jgi:hypothetical protein